MEEPSGEAYDAVVIGGGHNGLACAAYLAAAGRSVVVLERSAALGGAARSERIFAGHDANISKYSYLVSLLPAIVVDELGLDIAVQRREVSSYTPRGDGGVLVDAADPVATSASLGVDAAAWDSLYAMTGRAAERIFPTLTEPLHDRDAMRRHVGDDVAWTALVERPIGELIERRFTDDTVRGIVLTDALIGTFTDAHDLAANRCFLYHVIGGGTGRWDVPVGGMGTVAAQLAAAASGRGAELCTGVEVVAVVDGRRLGDGAAGLWPADRGPPGVRQRGAGRARPIVGSGSPGSSAAAVEGAQVKVNMLLSRLPRLRDRSVAPARAFAGTFHVNEGYAAARPRLPAGRRRDDPRGRPVRDLLPLADRSLDPRPVAPRRRRPDADAVRAAHADAAVPCRSGRLAGGRHRVDHAVAEQRAR